MDKLTVGIILEPDYNPTVGGGFSYYDTLVQHIDQYEFDNSLDIVFLSIGSTYKGCFTKKVVCIEPKKYHTKKDKLREKIVRTLSRPLLKSIRYLNRLRLKFASTADAVYNRYTEKELIEQKIDLIYYLIPGSVKLNYPYILTHWDNGHLSMYSFPEVSMNGIYEYRENYFRIALGKAFAIFCESNAGKDELVKYTSINPERIFVVPMVPGNVVHLNLESKVQQEILARFELDEHSFFFYPAQFWSHKNHYNLLHAFKKIVEAYPNFKLVFTGSDKGNLHYVKKVITDLQLEKHVLVAGFVDYDELFTLYKNAIALVMPTLLGPSNIPLLEAQAIGCPIICSDFKGHREMLGEDAYFIDPSNFESIFEAMLISINEQEGRTAVINQVFNINSAVAAIERNLNNIAFKRKTFGYNYFQF